MQDFNVSPYYDDFDADKNFHKILFKPGVSVQARELTQVQSILQDQILKFGNHIFKHGSVVIPGNSGSDLNAPYVKLQPLTGAQLEIFETFENNKVVGSLTGIVATVRKTVRPGGSEPATIYVQYESGGTNGESVFQDGEQLVVSGNTITAIESSATGLGSLAYVHKGVYYVYGNFVTVQKQFIPIDKYTQTPSCHVLLKIGEEIVDSDMDSTLLDPAQGSYNFAAPGADRQKITLTLTTLPLGADINDDYFELMRFNNGVLEEHSRYPKYNELEKSLARRTYDESGDYVVNGLEVSVKEHLRNETNGGIYSVDEGGDKNKFVAVVNPGKAYIQGFENEKISTSYVSVDKGRTPDHIKTKSNIGFFPAFGQFFYISDLKNLPNISSRVTIKFFKDLAKTQLLGTAKIMSLNLHLAENTPEENIYKLFVYDININGNFSDAQVVTDLANNNIGIFTHRINVSNSGEDFATGDIFSILSINAGQVIQYLRSSGSLYFKRTSSSTFPAVGDRIVSGTKIAIVSSLESSGNLSGNSSIIQLPFGATYKIRNEENIVDTSYSVFKQIEVQLVNGSGTGSIAGAVMESFGQADPIVIHPTSGTITVTPSDTTIASNTITFVGLQDSGGPINGQVSVIVTASKYNQINKTKTLVVFSETKPSTSIVALSKCDVYKINSIIEVDTGLDVTSSYTLDNGQRDFAYENGSLNLVGTLPTGNITISYQYFQHTGNGDYFSVDSYEFSGLGSDYYDKIPEYRSQTDGKLYALKNCLDFRPRISTEPTDTSLIDLVQINSRMSTSIRYYVPRYDIIVMEKSGKLRNISGIPAENPILPKQPSDSILLATIGIPSYTAFIKNIQISKAKNQGYTMSKIASIEDRILKLEQYSLLTQSEKTLLNVDVIDATTGLSRFKSGYLVDSFDNPDIISDIFNPDFSATYVDGLLFPKMEYNEFDLSVSNYSNITWNSAGFYTLPYSDVVFAQQNLSSKFTNVNPFAVYSWNGVMTLAPATDSWVETINLPTVFNNYNTQETVDIEVPLPPPPPPAPPVVIPPPQIVYVEVPVPTPPPLPEPPAPPPVLPPPPVPALSSNDFQFGGGISVPEFSFEGLKSSLSGLSTAEWESPALPPLIDFSGFDAWGGSGESFGSSVTFGNVGSIGGGFGGGMGGGGGGGGSTEGCFVSTTLIDMFDGRKIPISEVKIGDLVWNWNKTSYNKVRFVEIVDNRHDLFTPDHYYQPFATVNHPLYINGVLSCVDEKSNYSNWLGPMKKLEPFKVTKAIDCKVYNLWVSGDNTYRVNDYGTNSILGDGGWMSMAHEQGLLSQEEVVSLVNICSQNDNRQLGALLVNNFIRNCSNKLFNKLLANALKKSGIKQQIILGLFGIVGKFSKKNKQE